MIEVGEYVRFEHGRIEVVTYQLKKFIDEHISKSENNRVEFLGKIKHSKNIIDLIEVGDYVNGEKVIYEDTAFNKGLAIIDKEYGLLFLNEFEIKDIKTILTKEQYEANCYKVKEEIC